MGESRLYADLTKLGIEYDVVEHEAVFTVEQSSRLDRDIPGAHTKNLFLKDGAGQFWLVTVPAHIRVDLKKLPEAIGCKRVSFGKAEDMVRLLGIEPGSVTPLAAINDQNDVVRIIVDARLVASGRLNVHPLRNTATLGLSADDLLRALTHWRHSPVVVMIPSVD
jgi:Ala-tRNA(Pro) deacylase